MPRIQLLEALLLLCGGAARAEEQEATIKQAQLPAPVLAAIRKKYPAAKLLRFTREVEKGKTAYEVLCQVRGRRLEVSFSPEGRVLSEEEQRKAKFAFPPPPFFIDFEGSSYGPFRPLLMPRRGCARADAASS